MKIEEINAAIRDIKANKQSVKAVSDTYHTFGELYEHRNRLFIAVAKARPDLMPYRSTTNADGSRWGDSFVLGLGNAQDKNQITYHLPMKYWDNCDFARTLDRAYWDGHTSDDVLERLLTL